MRYHPTAIYNQSDNYIAHMFQVINSAPCMVSTLPLSTPNFLHLLSPTPPLYPCLLLTVWFWSDVRKHIYLLQLNTLQIIVDINRLYMASYLRYSCELTIAWLVNCCRQTVRNKLIRSLLLVHIFTIEQVTEAHHLIWLLTVSPKCRFYR